MHKIVTESSESKAQVDKICLRPRKSPYPMISVEEAQEKVLAMATFKETVSMPLSQAVGLVLAADIGAKAPVPPFRASIKVIGIYILYVTRSLACRFRLIF